MDLISDASHGYPQGGVAVPPELAILRVMREWNSEAVLALAPDAASAAAGRGLASARKWSGIGRSVDGGRAIWGLCQGSGKDPYRTCIDLAEPAFKCSCPSRKFPCKHGLGLMLLFAADAASFSAGAEPDWAEAWLVSRTEKAEKKVEKAKAAADKPVDVEQQAKRAAQRASRVMDGVSGCRVWIEDVVRRGLASARTQAGEWEKVAARMVDAQATGLASMLRRTAEVMSSGEGWAERTLDHLGRIHLLLTAAEKLDSLPPDLAAEVRTELGWSQSREEILASAGTSDTWMVVGQVTDEEERLRARRTWLVGRASGARALVLDYAAGTQAMDASLHAGATFRGELAWYAGRLRLRALVKSRESAAGESGDMGDVGAAADATIAAGLERYAHALASNPWLRRWPLVLTETRAAQSGGAWVLRDRTGATLPLAPAFADSLAMWRLVSACAAGPRTITAEWDGRRALPLNALDGAYVDLASRQLGGAA